MHHGCQVRISKTSTETQSCTYALDHNQREKHTNNSYPVMRSQYNFTDQTRSDAAESRYLALTSIFHYRSYIWQQESLPHNKLDQQTYPWKDWMSVSEDLDQKRAMCHIQMLWLIWKIHIILTRSLTQQM